MPHSCPCVLILLGLCSDKTEGKHDVIVHGEGIGLIRAINTVHTSHLLTASCWRQHQAKPSRTHFLWSEAEWQLGHCVGHRRPTWTPLKDWEHQGTVRPGRSWIYNVFMFWTLACLMCCCSLRFPVMKKHLLNTGLKPRHGSMCQQHSMWWSNKPTSTQLLSHGGSLPAPGLLWEGTASTAASLAEPWREETLLRFQWVCKEEKKLSKSLCDL